MIGSTRTGTIGIGLAVSLHNAFSGQARQVSASMNQLNRHQRDLARNSQAIGGAMMIGAGAMIMPIGRAIKSAAKFEYTLAGVKAMANATASEFKLLNDQALTLGRTTIFTAQKVGEAQMELAKAGYSSTDILGSMGGIVALSAATDVDLAKSADFVASVRNAFQLPIAQTEKIADIITTATVASQADMPDLVQGLKYSSARATSLNVSLEETVSLLATLNNMGLRGSVGGVSVDNLLRNLSKALTDFKTKRQDQALKAMGLSTEDILTSTGAFKNLVDIMDIVQQKMAGISPNEQTAIASALVGERGARGLVLAMQAGTREGVTFKQMYQEIINSDGEAKRIMAERLDNLYGDLVIMESAIEGLFISLGKALSPMLRPALKIVTTIIDLITGVLSTGFGSFLAMAITSGAVVLGLLGTYRFLMGSLALITGQATFINGTFFSSAAAGWNTLTMSAARYATLLKGLNAMGLLGAMGLSVGAGGRLFNAATGRFAGRGAIQMMAKNANLAAIAMSGLLGPLKAMAIGLIGLLGPVAGLVATFAVLAGAAYAIYKIFGAIDRSKKRENFESSPLGEYLRVQKAYTSGRVYTTDPGSFTQRPLTPEEREAALEKQFRKMFGADSARTQTLPNGSTQTLQAGQIMVVVNGTLTRVGRKDIEQAFKKVGQ